MEHRTPKISVGYTKIVVKKFGDVRALLIQSDITHNPPKGYSLVKVAAIGVGYTDVMARRGEYLFQRKRPFSPGYECTGTVVCSTPDRSTVTWEPGSRVAVCLPHMSAYAEYVTVPTKLLVSVPDELSLEVAASMSLNFLTALALLERSTQLKRGDSVLIEGAAGGVGEALCQLGKHMGLQMYGTASAKSFPQLRAYSVEPIDYTTQNFAQVLAQKQPKGVDVVFDHIGGKNLSKAYHVLAPGGTIVSYAFMGRPGHILVDTLRGAIHNRLLNLLPGKHALLCSVPPLIASHPSWYREALTRLFGLAVDGTISPHIGHRFALREAAAAHELLEAHGAVGKIILLTSMKDDREPV